MSCRICVSDPYKWTMSSGRAGDLAAAALLFDENVSVWIFQLSRSSTTSRLLRSN